MVEKTLSDVIDKPEVVDFPFSNTIEALIKHDYIITSSLQTCAARMHSQAPLTR